MNREYAYVGSKKILEGLPTTSMRQYITSPQNVIDWMRSNEQKPDQDGLITVTFIIDVDGQLWINNHQRSEHVLCAAGGNVLSAGEMTFHIDKNTVEVFEVTNQSTGYCPEPESWWTVTRALTNAKIPHPAEFTIAYIFRWCANCETKNIVKDDWYVCAVCDAPLSKTWNFEV